MKKLRWRNLIWYTFPIIGLVVGLGINLGVNTLLSANNDLKPPTNVQSVEPVSKPKPEVKPYNPLDQYSITELVRLTNEERAKLGLAPLANNTLLNTSAQAKAEDMAKRNYWSHNTPDGQLPWGFIKAQGYNYTKAAENLACGHNSDNETVTDWMTSPLHKANIVDPELTEVGFGIVKSEDYDCGDFPLRRQIIVVQHFGTPKY